MFSKIYFATRYFITNYFGGSVIIEETATGGVVCGSSAIVAIRSNRVATGGIVCGGIALNSERELVLATGGVLCGSSAIIGIRSNRTATGGVLCGSSAIIGIRSNRTATGGVLCGDSSVSKIVYRTSNILIKSYQRRILNIKNPVALQYVPAPNEGRSQIQKNKKSAGGYRNIKFTSLIDV